MPKSPSKKRRKLSSVDYRKLKTSNTNNRTPSNSPNKKQSSNVSHVISASSNPFYEHKLLSKGIDLSSFRSHLLLQHEAPSNNIPNIISRMINTIKITPSCFSEQTSHSNLSSSSDNNHHVSSSIELTNMSQCVVEDVMTIKDNTEIVLLLPILCNKEDCTPIHNSVQILCKKSYVYFTSDRRKYYLFWGYVHSNPDKFVMSCDAMFKSEVMKAFTFPNNNGKGFTAKLSQQIFL